MSCDVFMYFLRPSNAAFYAAVRPAVGTFFTPSFMATAIACVISPPGCMSAHKDGQFQNLARGRAFSVYNLVMLFSAFLVSLEAA